VRFRFGTVVSVQNDWTCTVTIAGSASSVAGVRYAAHVTPLPGAACVLASDGSDLFVVAVLAAADRTLAPRAYRSADLTVTDSTDTAVTWAAANSDAWGCWSGSNATRLTAKVRGRYQATGWAQFAINGTGVRAVWVVKGGTDVIGRVQVSASSAGPTHLTVQTPGFDLEVGEYVEMFVRQTSGGNLTLTRSGTLTPALTLAYLGP
jgi:hypothetical protein